MQKTPRSFCSACLYGPRLFVGEGSALPFCSSRVIFVARASSPVMRCKNTASPALSEANGMAVPPGMFDVRIHRKNREARGATAPRSYFKLQAAELQNNSALLSCKQRPQAPAAGKTRSHVSAEPIPDSKFKMKKTCRPEGGATKHRSTRRLPEVLEPTTIAAGARLAPCRGCKI